MLRGDAELLQSELDKLDEWLKMQVFHIAYEHILRIRIKLYTGLNHPSHLADYLEDAITINGALANQNDLIALNTLQRRAETTIGSSLPERKALGASMIVLGIGLLVLSMLVMSCVLACAFPLASFFLVTAGCASLCLGIGLFRSGLQHGMAKEISELHYKLN